ncbi:MAG: hypothetical protein OJF47_003928 [Nitrospira sp.]|jgi:hypothetical protein|nr:MAG: hypothetical protein OJF47_003928 [Nitrospira sp.]
MTIDEIRQLVRDGRYEVSIHAQQERLEDDLDIDEIEKAVLQGELIEEYPNDPRGPSCLVGGMAGVKPIHVVLGWATRKQLTEKTLRMITVYIPRPPKWKDMRTRGARP